MNENNQDISSIRDILHDVDSVVAADRVERDKKIKRVTVRVIVCIAIVVVLIGYVFTKYIQKRQLQEQERQFNEELLETAISVTSKYGIDDLTIVSISHPSDSYHSEVIFQSDIYTDLSDKDKLGVFREFNQLTVATYGVLLHSFDKGRVVIVSDGTRYTAEIIEMLTGSYYRHLYADGDEILKEEYTAPSSGSSSSGASSGGQAKACSGGSVGCRSGFHPCHEMSNGYCNMCCKDP